MIRSQVYLTKAERKELTAISAQTGKSQSELIREAIDRFIAASQHHRQDKLAIIRATKGIWSKRNDLPDFAALRKELDREK
jgi:predicted DNA-binding protein